MSSSLSTILAHVAPTTGTAQPVLGDIALFVALSMAAFAVLFGTRHIDATEHQDGLMLAIAAESIVKLVAFLAVGVFVTFWMFDGPVGLFSQAMERADTAAVLTARAAVRHADRDDAACRSSRSCCCRGNSTSPWSRTTAKREIKRAAWLFPLYLVLINLFVVPIAMAGLLTFPAGKVDSDMFVLALPLIAKSDIFTLIAFIGGLSAATAMVIVETVALAIMVSNDIVMPLVLQAPRGAASAAAATSAHCCCTVRRTAIFVILLLAYLYYRSAGDAQLAAIGLLAFAAVAQLAPAFFGGLFWRRGTRAGAIAGMTIGILTWAYTLLLPSIADVGIIGRHVLIDGPFGIAMLRPQALFGLDAAPAGARRDLEPRAQRPRLYRLLAAPRADLDRAYAGRRVRARASRADGAELPAVALDCGDGRGTDLHRRALSRRGAHAVLVRKLRHATAHRASSPTAEADFQLLRYAEHLLASAIGAASSRLVLSLLLRKRTVSTKAALKLLDDAKRRDPLQPRNPADRARSRAPGHRASSTKTCG